MSGFVLYPSSIYTGFTSKVPFRAKAPGFCDRKWVHIDLILTHLRSLNRGSFRFSPNGTFEVKPVYIGDEGLYLNHNGEIIPCHL